MEQTMNINNSNYIMIYNSMGINNSRCSISMDCMYLFRIKWAKLEFLCINTVCASVRYKKS